MTLKAFKRSVEALAGTRWSSVQTQMGRNSSPVKWACWVQGVPWGGFHDSPEAALESIKAHGIAP